MKRLIQIVLSIQFVLMLANCATSTDNLYKEYTACRVQTLHPKITDAGVVVVNKDGTPVMIYTTGACPDELAKWEKSHVLREKRRREREAYDAVTSSCGDGSVLVCSGRGVSKCISRAGVLHQSCKCSCMSHYEIRGLLGTRW